MANSTKLYTEDSIESLSPLEFTRLRPPEYNVLIEYDGQQHFQIAFGQNEEKLILQQKYDKIKDEWCKENNIKLIRIPYYQKKITLQNLIQ